MCAARSTPLELALNTMCAGLQHQWCWAAAHWWKTGRHVPDRHPWRTCKLLLT